MTPEMVLKASGHVDRFTDFMVTDVVTHDCHRADHLLKAALEAVQADKEQTPQKTEVCPVPAYSSGHASDSKSLRHPLYRQGPLQQQGLSISMLVCPPP